MKLEQITAPLPEQSPQQKYASLHRAVEKGLASESTWAELAKVCADIGLVEESKNSFDKVVSPTERNHVRNHLVRRGVLEPEPGTNRGQNYVDSDPPPSFREEIVDSFRFLFIDHMPLTVIVATMAFPLVVGLGGFLTASSNMLLFSAIALVPGLTVLGMVGALGRRIMQEASHGIDDAPRIPEVGRLFKEGTRFLTDGILLALLFFAPAIVTALTGGPAVGIAAAIGVGALLLPMAMVLRQITNDWRMLSPNILFRAIVTGGAPYYAAATVCFALFLPAAAALVLTFGSQPYLQVSVVGPLMVAPLFVAARLLGRVFALRRDELAMVIASNVVAARTTPRRKVSPTTSKVSRPQRTAPPPRQRLSASSHPEAARFGTPVPVAAPVPVMAGNAVHTPAPTMGSAHHPAVRPTPTLGLEGLAAAKPGSGELPNARKSAPSPSRHIVGEDIPDLTKMPGFNVVTGKERDLAGASALSRQTPAQPTPAVRRGQPTRKAAAPQPPAQKPRGAQTSRPNPPPRRP